MFETKGLNKIKLFRREISLGYLYLIPLIVFFALVIYPLFRVIYLSFFQVSFLNPSLKQLVGLGNYRSLFDLNASFLPALARSLIWVSGSVALKTFFGMFGALLFNRDFPGRNVYRGLSIIPWGIPWAVSAMMWGWTYNTQYGFINALLKNLGLISESIGFLSDPTLAFISLMVVDAWIGIPFMIIMLEAGLKGIPTQLYEAAEIDGANPLQSFIYVTLPQIKGVLTTAVLLSTVWTFNSFDPIWILTQGGPVNSTTTLPIAIYKSGFQMIGGGDLGQAAAMTIAQVIVVSFIAYFYLRALKKQGGAFV